MEQNPDTLRDQIITLELELKKAFDSGKSFYEKKELIQRIKLLHNELNALTLPFNQTLLTHNEKPK